MTKHAEDPTPSAIVREAHAEEPSEERDDDTSETSVRQLLHWAAGDRKAEAQALADEAPGDVSQKDAEIAVKRAHGDVPSDRPIGSSEIATPVDAETVNEERAAGLPSQTIDAERRDAQVSAGVDEMPTLEEESAAEAAAEHVDVESVARHEHEMMDLGANVKGEGQVPRE